MFEIAISLSLKDIINTLSHPLQTHGRNVNALLKKHRAPMHNHH